MKDILDIPVSSIEVGQRLRPVDPAKVELIADSYRRQGQIAPIEVAPRGPGKWKLVIGLHRLEGARKAGRPTIQALRFDGDADAQQLREIEENLVRHDLNALDRAFHVERWFHHLGVLRKKGVSDKSIANQSFAEIAKRIPVEIAEKAGLSERSIYNDLKLARMLADVRDKLAGLPIANSQADLLRFSKLEPTARRSAISALQAGKSFQEAAGPKKSAAVKKGKDGALHAAWRKASAAEQDIFLRAAIKGLTDKRRNDLCAWIVAKGLMTKVPG